MLKTLYVGRLDAEKGIKHLLYSYTKLLEEGREIQLHIYGDGIYRPQIEHLANKYPDYIYYYGWQKKNKILTEWVRMDYFIMPSDFLETFGLTACESLCCGVPVIGNKKGGLEPFIANILNIQAYSGSHNGEKLYQTLVYILDNQLDKSQFEPLIRHTQSQSTTEQRYRQIHHFLPTDQKVLMISDYISYQGGGVETHLHDSRAILQHHNHETLMLGAQLPQGTRKQFRKLLSMLGSLLNIKKARELRSITKKENIGLVWWHSISRVRGWLPMLVCNHNNQIITHHEMGLFHPYPSQVFEISDLPPAWDLRAFIKAGKPKQPRHYLFIAGKYALVRLLHKQLKSKIKTHIIPSERMRPIVQSRYPNANIQTINHFINIDEEKTA